jgi:hypothetical protein
MVNTPSSIFLSCHLLFSILLIYSNNLIITRASLSHDASRSAPSLPQLRAEKVLLASSSSPPGGGRASLHGEGSLVWVSSVNSSRFSLDMKLLCTMSTNDFRL